MGKTPNKPLTVLKTQMRFGFKTERCPWCTEHYVYLDDRPYRKWDTLFECSRRRIPDNPKDKLLYSATEPLMTDMDGTKPQPCLTDDWHNCPLRQGLTEMADKPIIQSKSDMSEAQADFLQCCEKLGWGKIEVTIQNGEPAFSRVLEVTHQHKKH